MPELIYEKLVSSRLFYMVDSSLEQGKKSREKQRKGNSTCDVFRCFLYNITNGHGNKKWLQGESVGYMINGCEKRKRVRDQQASASLPSWRPQLEAGSIKIKRFALS